MTRTIPWLVIAVAVFVIGSPITNAELISKDRLATCELHAVGIYSPENNNTDDRVTVDVTITGRPIVLVLSAYFGTQWNLNIADGADIRQIIVPGYFRQEVVGAPEGVPIETICWFTKDEKNKRKDYFYTYALDTHDGREFQSRLKKMTGLPLTTFQGNYQAKHLKVDGKRGGDLSDSKVVTESSASSKASTGSRNPADDLSVESLVMIESATQELAGEIRSGDPSPRQMARLETLVQQSFDLETKVYESRLEAAAKRLQLIEQQLASRKENADTIIAKRLEELIGEKDAKTAKTAEPQDPKIVAEGLSSEGWQLWMKQDYAAAVIKFEKAVEMDPSSNPARNGLGWSQIHLQRPQAASITFRDLLADEPDHGGARNGLGHAFLALGKTEAASDEFLTAVETAIESMGEPRAAKVGMAAWFGLVNALQELGKLDEAKTWASRYLAHNDDDQMKRIFDSLEGRLAEQAETPSEGAQNN